MKMLMDNETHHCPEHQKAPNQMNALRLIKFTVTDDTKMTSKHFWNKLVYKYMYFLKVIEKLTTYAPTSTLSKTSLTKTRKINKNVLKYTLFFQY